ncbi:MAG: GNAT family N-acetyltransferase, partial [Chloroflexales bacterium]|nr:GNAT family N-acetyltransferase [Chloroflexales bacterium]
MSYRVLGYSYLWSPRDGLPPLPALPGFRASSSTNVALLAQLTELAPRRVTARLQSGHLAYLAWLEDATVAYGWVATQRHGIEELDISYELPARCRALWDFRTLTPWRGRGVYPHLLQAILRSEAPAADWFEIGHVAGNTASQRGIIAAG